MSLFFNVSHLDHVSHVALRSCVVRLVFLAHQNDKVEVVPDIVLQFDVLFERHRLIVKLVSLEACSRTKKTKLLQQIYC